MPDKFIINKNYNNSRLDKWFKEKIKNLPNSLFQKLLRKNKVKVNNKKIKSSFRLSEGDEVSIFNISHYKPTDLKKKIKITDSWWRSDTCTTCRFSVGTIWCKHNGLCSSF